MPKFKFNQDKLSPFPKNEAELSTLVHQLYQTGLETKRSQELQWAINIAYYAGYQNLRLFPYTLRLETQRGISSHPLIVNRFAAFIDTRTAKITKNRPIMSVDPSDTGEFSKREAARLAEETLKHFWNFLDMDELSDSIVLQIHLTGNAFFKYYWDALAGDTIEEIVQTKDNMIFLDPKTGLFKSKDIRIGEVAGTVKSAFSIIPSPGALTLDKCDWIIDRSFISTLKAQEMYGEIGEKINAASRSDYTPMESFVSRLGTNIFKDISPAPNESLGVSLVKEFWLRPNIYYPEGMLAVYVGTELARITPLPYYMDEAPIIFPYSHFIEKKDPFSFWGKTTAERLVPLQRQYNKDRRDIATNTSRMAKLKWIVAKGSQIHEDAFDDQSGEVIEWNSVLPAHKQSDAKPLPNYVIENLNASLADMRDVGGEREVTGTPPSNVTAGIAMQVEQEIRDQVITPIIKRFERSMGKVGEGLLKLANQFYDEPRRIKIVGDDDRAYIKFLDKTDLKYQTDVRVVIESAFPHFKAAKRQAILEMWDRQLVQDPERVKIAFVTGDLEGLLKEGKLKEDAILMGIEDIKNGRMPPIHDKQDHAGWVDKFTKFVNSPMFHNLPKDRADLAFQVIQAHLDYLQGQFGGQAGAAGGALGQGGTGGRGVNPAGMNTPFGIFTPASLEGGGPPSAEEALGLPPQLKARADIQGIV